ncbi:hypothetical protein K435DRAFT_171877 [Dendrothele bispora CBS 962.96]|uniref:Uncharacterized protein n=1 Tax=Dendrothele bispora (strain CBS 962.96) TaxID=1314807 RepID=A0A4S8MWZ4_DENBC|nr:hypothetical protein K435DRAFT_171877 [Dendrothele bispora CBS 962.96]
MGSIAGYLLIRCSNAQGSVQEMPHQDARCRCGTVCVVILQSKCFSSLILVKFRTGVRKYRVLVGTNMSIRESIPVPSPRQVKFQVPKVHREWRCPRVTSWTE